MVTGWDSTVGRLIFHRLIANKPSDIDRVDKTGLLAASLLVTKNNNRDTTGFVLFYNA
jgi:hypothetical protein